MIARTAFVAFAAVLLAQAASALESTRGHDCGTEARILHQARSELPRLDAASPQDRPPYCITLETLMAFAGRLKAHAAHCPNSELAADAAQWVKIRTGYSKLFVQHRCKRTM